MTTHAITLSNMVLVGAGLGVGVRANIYYCDSLSRVILSKSLNSSHHKLINLLKSSTVLLIVCIEIGKITVQNVKPQEIIPFLWLTSEPFKLHKCDRVLKTRPCNAMSNGIDKDMHFRCHTHNARKVNMSMGQRMQ